MRLAVVGSRSFDNKARLAEVLAEYSPSEIISGGAQGADTLAAEWAREHAIPVREFLPDYARYGRAAPLKRNVLIVDNADLLIAFWDGSSRGTKHTIDRAQEKGVKVRIERFSTP